MVSAGYDAWNTSAYQRGQYPGPWPDRAADAFTSGSQEGGLRLVSAPLGDDGSAYLEELHERARIEWGYLVPSSEEQALRRLCDTILDFENECFAWMKNEVERLVRDGSNDVNKPALEVLPKLGARRPSIRLMDRMTLRLPAAKFGRSTPVAASDRT